MDEDARVRDLLNYDEETEPKYYVTRSKSNYIKGAFMVILTILMAILSVLRYIAGAAIYIWTLFIAFTYGGFVAAMITFMLPVIGQIYWGYKSIVVTGTFWNSFIAALIGYIMLWLLFFLFAAILGWLDE